MTPEFKILLDALDELNGLLEADALPDVCIPRSIHIEVPVKPVWPYAVGPRKRPDP